MQTTHTSRWYRMKPEPYGWHRCDGPSRSRSTYVLEVRDVPEAVADNEVETALALAAIWRPRSRVVWWPELCRGPGVVLTE
ncbi:MAG: hypothetical protein N3D77_03025 [Geminicoccaceae bacterium]|nr:hypothetical protein [Geminicoccaceae bacterium]